MLKTNSLKLTFCAGLAAVSLAALPSSLFAGTEDMTKETKVVEATKSSITGDLGVNFVSQYISRGISLENQGVIAQPYADLYFALYEGTGFINKVSLNLGIWSSLNSRKTGATADSTVAVWNEFDYTPGIAVTFAKNFTLTTSYFEFDAPNGGYDPARSINLRLDYSDADLLGAFALHPHLAYLKELSGKAGSGPANKKGDYYEVGIAPALPAFGPVTVSFPTTAGFGSAGFYAHNGFGYFSVGPNVAVSLSFIPARLGVWTANFGATYYYLHDTLATATGIQPAGHNSWVYNGGIGMTF